MVKFLINAALCGLSLTSCAQEPEPVETASSCQEVPRFEAGALVARDCAALPGTYWQSDDARGGIVLLHNFGDYHQAFSEIGPKLQRAGYSSIAFDQRGFGEAGERGRWYGGTTLKQDAQDAVTILRGDLVDKPVFVLGESMGGSVAMILAAEGSSVDGLILAAPGVREGIDYRWFWDAALWVGETFAPALDVNNPRGDNDTLSAAAQKRLSGSPNVVRDVRLDTYAGLIDLTDAASKAADKINTPSLLLYGGEDDTVDPVAIKNAEAALGVPTVKRYPNAPHLLFQSTYQDTVLEDTLAWLEQQETPQ